jgi:CheY-like chemotaxis protein
VAVAAPLTLLVVDDQALFRRSLEDRLRGDGYKVASAGNGLEALELLEETPSPCLILLDLMMPVMNGVEFLHALERRRDRGEVRVVLISAYGVVDRVALGSPRIVGRLHKPVEMGELRQMLDGQLGIGFGRPSLPN